jgi:hypothetical protein
MDYNTKIAQSDSILQATIYGYIQRADKGKIKYGTTLDRTDLIDTDYLQHMKEEMMDCILYINKFISIQQK